MVKNRFFASSVLGLAGLVICSVLFETNAWGAQIPVSAATVRAQLLTSLKEQSKRKDKTFDSLIRKWELQFNTAAVEPLLEIAANRGAFEDHERYVAMMGASKIGGRGIGPRVVSFLDDRSWMLRAAALQILGLMKINEANGRIVQKLKDPALAVRLQAVRTLAALQSPDAVPALISALKDPANFHRGKAQWVPQGVLRALTELKAKASLGDLKFLLDQKNDPEMLKLTVKTFEALSGKKLKAGRPLKEQVGAWKKYLSASVSGA